jgi:hypothetical protein
MKHGVGRSDIHTTVTLPKMIRIITTLFVCLIVGCTYRYQSSINGVQVHRCCCCCCCCCCYIVLLLLLLSEGMPVRGGSAEAASTGKIKNRDRSSRPVRAEDRGISINIAIHV